MNKSDYQVIGRVIGAHGRYGELKVFPITADPDRFYDIEHCFIEDKKSKSFREFTVEQVRLHKGNALVAVEGVNDRGAALEMKGLYLMIPKSERIELSEGEFFLEDLMSCAVKEENGDSVGTVSDFLDYGGSGLLSIKLDSGKSIDLPFVDVYIADVQIDNNLVIVTQQWRDLLDLS
jgi:16S rRNA processing protein RimM